MTPIFAPLLISATSEPISLLQLLRSKERRQRRQQAWLARYGVPLLSFTVVAPGAYKDTPLTRQIYNAGLLALADLVLQHDWQLDRGASWSPRSGPEGLVAINGSADEIKQHTIALEQHHPLGRLWDLDVIQINGEPLSRSTQQYPARQCLLCDRPASECARTKRHSVDELVRQMQEMVNHV